MNPTMGRAQTLKRTASKLPNAVEQKIIDLSLQNPDYGARRLLPLLKLKKVHISASSIYSILRRHGLQTRAKRLAKLKKQARKPKSTPKKPSARIPDKVVERIVRLSLKNPELGARRLVSLLKQKKVDVSSSTVYTILKRNGIQTRKKRLAKLEERSKKIRKPKSTPRKPSTKISDEIAGRIVEISLQNPDFGARRLLPLLKKEKIRIPASTVYAVLKRHGLQSRAKRLAKIQKTTAEPVLFPKKFPQKIPPEVEDRVVDLSLQNPDYGARRLAPLLQQEEIFVSASAVYTILKHNGLGTRKKRLLKLEKQQALEVPLPPIVKMPPEAETPEPVPEPAVVIPTPPLVEEPLLTEALEPVPEPAAEAPIPAEAPPVKRVPIKPVKKRGHWVFYPIYLLLFALIGYLGFHAVQAIQYTRVETEAVTTDDAATVGIGAKTDASERPLDGYRQIWQRNLFNITKPKDPDSEKKISLHKIALAKKDLGLELVGTVVADDPMMSRAIIDNRSIRKQEAYREGDKAGKVRIKKILRNNVVITTANGDELLTVKIKESGKRSTPSSPTRRVGSSSSSKQQTPSSPRSSARTSSISLKRDEVESSLADIDAMMQQMRLTPYMQGDQPSGFRLGNIPRDSVLRKMGLRSRDVIVGVNDESITDPAQAADFFQTIAEGGEVTIKLKRRRRTRQIHLNIE
jgi:general secretion pathway protein C